MRAELEKFLLGTYFNDSDILQKEDADIITICVNKAYLDLARTIKFLYSTEELKKEDKKKRRAFSENKAKFKENVSKCISDGIGEKYDPMKIIEDVLKESKKFKIFKPEYSFSLGQAQKWVNMTLKYLWLLEKNPISESKLHVPIDRYIIHAMTGDKNNKYALSVKVSGFNGNDSWSSMKCIDIYIKIQEEILKQCKNKGFSTRISWENAAWIEQAMIENKSYM